MKKKYTYLFVLLIVIVFCENTKAQVIWSQNFEGNAWTPTAYVVGTTGGAATTLTDGAPANVPAGGQACYGAGSNNSIELWHRSDFQGAWTNSYDICGGTYTPPAGGTSCGANGTNHSLIFDGYDAQSGRWGLFTYPNALAASTLDLSSYASCGGPVTLTFYYVNVDETNLLVSFWNGGAWVTAATLGTTANSWTPETVTVPASCLINGTYIQFEAISAYAFHPIGIDEIVLTGSPCCTPPTTQATNFTSSVVCGVSETIGWTRGNGNNVMVVARAGSATTGPTSGTAYTANTVYGSGTACGGGYCVYNGTGTSVTVTGLTAGTTYYYDIYEYSTVGTCYKTPSLSGNVLMTSNDNWACATTLTVGAAATAGNTTGATLEANESMGCNSASAGVSHTPTQSVWYKFTATATHSYVQINQTAGCNNRFGAAIWDETIIAGQLGTTYQVSNNQFRYCGMITCQSMDNNNAASNPFLFDLCHLTVGQVYYIQCVNNTGGGCGSASFNILVQNTNPGGTITNPCQPDGQGSNYLTSPLAECYINNCGTAPGCPSCTSYTLNGGSGEYQSNIVWNSYYSFTTGGGCSNDLEFQQCVSSTCLFDGYTGNVDWLSFQLYDATGTSCEYSGDFTTSTDGYGYLGIAGVGCNVGYILQYTTEQLPCTDYYYFTPFTDNYGSSSCLLPIVLLKFTAAENPEGTVDLHWATASETDENYYTLERSTDAKNFTKIGKVKGAGTTHQQTDYTFTDTTIVEENTIYYRLSQSDFNGQTNTFNIVEVNKTRNFSVSVYPNPSTGDFNLEFSSMAGKFVQVDILDATGIVVSSKTYMGSGGLQHQKIEPPEAGVYILQMKINGLLIRKKLVKL